MPQYNNFTRRPRPDPIRARSVKKTNSHDHPRHAEPAAPYRPLYGQPNEQITKDAIILRHIHFRTPPPAPPATVVDTGPFRPPCLPTVALHGPRRPPSAPLISPGRARPNNKSFELHGAIHPAGSPVPPRSTCCESSGRTGTFRPLPPLRSTHTQPFCALFAPYKKTLCALRHLSPLGRQSCSRGLRPGRADRQQSEKI